MKKLILVGTILAGYTNLAFAAEKGIASYYINPHDHGLIAAHKSLPFGCHVKVVNLDNGRTVVVKIIDRGPFIRGRVIDLSRKAAGVLGFVAAGTAHVQIERL